MQELPIYLFINARGCLSVCLSARMRVLFVCTCERFGFNMGV